MKDVLAMLVELQLLDDDLRDMRTIQQRLAKLTKDNAAGLAVFDTMLAERAERLAETKAFIKEKADEILKIEEDGKRSRGRMNSITSQRELTALNKELDTQRRMNLSRQTELTRLKAEYAEAETDHATKASERDGLAATMAELEAELKAQLAEKEASASDVKVRREALRQKMPRREISQYDRIARARKGTAVSNVVEGSCTACNMRVPPHQLQKVLRSESMERCQICQRILVSFAAAQSGQEA